MLFSLWRHEACVMDEAGDLNLYHGDEECRAQVSIHYCHLGMKEGKWWGITSPLQDPQQDSLPGMQTD